MFDGVSGTQVTMAAVVGLIGLCTCVAWFPATRRDPTGLATRVFITVGLGAAILDPRGVGAVLGLSLAAMGGLVWWEGQPEPEVPRPRRRGFYVAAVLAGLVTYGTVQGWGPLASIPEDGRPVAALFVGLVALLATLAIADRARITFRDKLRRRFSVPTPRPRMLVAPIDRPPASSVTLERLMPDDTGFEADPAPRALGLGRPPVALPPADVAGTADDPSAGLDDEPPTLDPPDGLTDGAARDDTGPVTTTPPPPPPNAGTDDDDVPPSADPSSSPDDGPIDDVSPDAVPSDDESSDDARTDEDTTDGAPTDESPTDEAEPDEAAPDEAAPDEAAPDEAAPDESPTEESADPTPPGEETTAGPAPADRDQRADAYRRS